jgi:uncharacterized protein (DUF736 family)
MEKQKSIGGLWSKTSSKNQPYFSGNIEIDGKKTYIVAFFNSDKKNQKEPDYRILESKPLEQKENALPQRATEAIDPALDSLDESEIPF